MMPQIIGLILLIVSLQNPPAQPVNSPQTEDTTAPLPLLHNIGFEEGESDPSGWQRGASVDGVEYLWDKQVAHDGHASLCLKKTNVKFFPIAQWQQSLTRVEPAPTLRVAVWVKALDVRRAAVDVQFIGPKDYWSHQTVTIIGPEQSDGTPVTHDWKEYNGAVTIPEKAKEIRIALQMIGAGTIWFDDVHVEYAAEPLPRTLDPDIADVPFQDLHVGDDLQKRYFLIGPKTEKSEPQDGYRLLVILAGADGGERQLPYIMRLFKYALPDSYLVVQPVAVVWNERQAQQIIWPTIREPWGGMRFSTEEFVESVITDVKKHYKIDSNFVFLLCWANSGPAGLEVSLHTTRQITGAMIAMSPYSPENLSSVNKRMTDGFPYYLYHSPQDTMNPLAFAQNAQRILLAKGAFVELATYIGGQGWFGDYLSDVRKGIDWLEKHHYNPDLAKCDQSPTPTKESPEKQKELPPEPSDQSPNP